MLVDLDLTFATGVRGRKVANVKSAPLGGSISRRHNPDILDHQNDALLRRPSSVKHALRDDHPLLWAKGNRAAFEIDQELSLKAEKELIIIVVFVPMILALHHAQPND